MKRIQTVKWLLPLLFVVATCASLKALDADTARQGVYEYVTEKSDVTFEQASQAILQEIQNSPFELVAETDAQVPRKCLFRARVFVLYDSAYVAQLFEINPLTAPFAAVDRINLFEDETGTNVAFVNPLSIARTVLLDDERCWEVAQSHHQRLRDLITRALPGEASHRQFGKFRKRGHIGKTFGIMAGGDFDKKIKEVAVLPDADFGEVVANLTHGLKAPGVKWGLHLIYSLNLPGREVAILGSSSPDVERKSFLIVKAGSDKSRKGFLFPGIAHAAAYPIEIVVAKEADGVKVRLVNMMYRMKMYFEDAGKMAFAKHMKMPGSIQHELEAQIQEALALRTKS